MASFSIITREYEVGVIFIKLLRRARKFMPWMCSEWGRGGGAHKT
jgi:hypothetical protein